jgi:voltage-gated potassium channel
MPAIIDQFNLNRNIFMYAKIKRKVYELLDPNVGGTNWDKFINVFIVTLIVLNVIAVLTETVSSIYEPNKKVFFVFEVFSVMAFTLEYFLRIWSCTCIEKYQHPFYGRLKYVFSGFAVIDLLAILPFYLPLIIFIDLRFIRILWLLRFLRFFKLSRYFNASRIITKVFIAKKDQLIISLIISVFLIIIASGLMYFTEHHIQPDKFSSIPETMWWNVATLTTIGYGDVFPVTVLGRTLTSIISILGIGMFALPAGILASGFSDEFRKIRKEKQTCPYCGKEIEDSGMDKQEKKEHDH